MLIGLAGLATLVPLSRAALAAGLHAPASPGWAFGFVLYPLLGLAAWLVWRRVDVALDAKRAALRRWGWVLLLGALWPAALFTAGGGVAALAFAALLLSLGVTGRAFGRLKPGAALLLAPYCLWLLCMAWLVTSV